MPTTYLISPKLVQRCLGSRLFRPTTRYLQSALFGTDEVAPSNQEKYVKVYCQNDPLWKELTPEASEKVRKGNYERLFNAARVNVRAWEKLT
jgi:hypothetical protein